MKATYTLAISSFAVHGTVSLKIFSNVLGEKVLPVPSLLLNGLTNMALVKKFDTPFKELLESTFELTINRDIDLILYIGYLGNAEQAAIIIKMIHQYRDRIRVIITDPVCGDNGRKYVPDDVIEQWCGIIRLSDMVFPNITEVKILTGNSPDSQDQPDFYAGQFQHLFPDVKLVVTSVQPTVETTGIQVYGNDPYSYALPTLPKNFGGTGDAFLALFILNHFYKSESFNEALKNATDRVFAIIKNSINAASTDLMISTT